MAEESKNSRIQTEIVAHAYTPVCPVHRVPMKPYKYGQKVVYFHCPERVAGCRRTDKAPKVPFVPNTGQR